MTFWLRSGWSGSDLKVTWEAKIKEEEGGGMGKWDGDRKDLEYEAVVEEEEEEEDDEN